MPVPPPTPTLVFREMTPDDLDDMAALLGDPEVMRYYPRPKNRDEAPSMKLTANSPPRVTSAR